MSTSAQDFLGDASEREAVDGMFAQLISAIPNWRTHSLDVQALRNMASHIASWERIEMAYPMPAGTRVNQFILCLCSDRQR